jgi:hypothetical protein
VVDFNVVELLKIKDSLPQIKEFITEMSYLKEIDLDLVYKQYKEVFMDDRSTAGELVKNATFKTHYDELVIKALKEKLK